jgi:hypothetical protein
MSISSAHRRILDEQPRVAGAGTKKKYQYKLETARLTLLVPYLAMDTTTKSMPYKQPKEEQTNNKRLPPPPPHTLMLLVSNQAMPTGAFVDNLSNPPRKIDHNNSGISSVNMKRRLLRDSTFGFLLLRI